MTLLEAWALFLVGLPLACVWILAALLARPRRKGAPLNPRDRNRP